MEIFEPSVHTWRFYALASAVFAALTAIFGKLGVSSMNSNLATLLRTVVILGISIILVSCRHEWQMPEDLSGRSLAFLVLSGFATGASWLCYYRALQLGPASQVAPVDKLSVVFVIVLAAIFLGESLTLKTILGGLMIVAGSLVLVL